MTDMEKKLAFLLATSPYFDAVDGSYDAAARDLVENGVAHVVRCKDCKYNGVLDLCPMCFEETVYQDEGNYPDGSECWDVYEQKVDRTVYDGFCDRGERRTDDEG
jgi:hypothetical protein